MTRPPTVVSLVLALVFVASACSNDTPDVVAASFTYTTDAPVETTENLAGATTSTVVAEPEPEVETNLGQVALDYFDATADGSSLRGAGLAEPESLAELYGFYGVEVGKINALYEPEVETPHMAQMITLLPRSQMVLALISLIESCFVS